MVIIGNSQKMIPMKMTPMTPIIIIIWGREKKIVTFTQFITDSTLQGRQPHKHNHKHPDYQEPSD